LNLKHTFNLSDEEVVARWSENVVWQYFSGQQYYEPRLPCDATQIGRFRTAIGEAGVEELLKATIDTAVQSRAVRPAEFERILVDTPVQEKAIAHPVDSRLLEMGVQATKFAGITLKQTFAKERKELRRKAGAMLMPNNSGACSGPSSGNAPSSASCCGPLAASSPRQSPNRRRPCSG
jgi:IS5 family transposase